MLERTCVFIPEPDPGGAGPVQHGRAGGGGGEAQQAQAHHALARVPRTRGQRRAGHPQRSRQDLHRREQQRGAIPQGEPLLRQQGGGQVLRETRPSPRLRRLRERQLRQVPYTGLTVLDFDPHQVPRIRIFIVASSVVDPDPYDFEPPGSVRGPDPSIIKQK
jgi:hypothetical protein